MVDRVTQILSEWKQLVSAGTFPSLLVLYGESDVIVRKGVEILLESVFAKGGRVLNHQIFDARSSRPAEWLVAARTAPMMGPRRVVQVTDAEVLFSKEGGLSHEDSALLLEFASSPRRGLIVFTCRTVDTRLKFLTALKAVGALHSFQPFESPEEVQEFIRGLFHRKGVSIDGEAVVWLAETLGRSAEAILSETDKLAEFVGEKRNVTLADAQEMVQRLQGHELFELSRAIVQRDSVMALTLLGRMFSSLVSLRKKVPQAALPLIVLSTCVEGELRKMAIAKEYEKSADRAGLAARLNVKENVAGIILSNASRFTVQELDQALVHVHEVDKRLKSTSLPPKLLLEDLVLSICLRRR